MGSVARLWTPLMATERESWHGTIGGYTNHKCRCAECRAAWSSYMTEYKKLNPDIDADMRRHAQARGFVPEERHGTTTGYRYYGCRCNRCLAAQRDYMRHYLARKAVAANGVAQKTV